MSNGKDAENWLKGNSPQQRLVDNLQKTEVVLSDLVGLLEKSGGQSALGSAEAESKFSNIRILINKLLNI